MSEFKRIPPEQALELRKQEGAVVVDIRDSQAFAAGHITGARHLDNHSVAEFIRNAIRATPIPANVITPLNVYLAVMVGFAAKYQKDAGIGTIVSLMLPYTVVLIVLWTLLLIVWTWLGIPLGPA